MENNKQKNYDEFMAHYTKQSNNNMIVSIIAHFVAMFIRVSIFYVGCLVLCSHLNIPHFSYLEIFMIYLGIRALIMKRSK